MSSSMLTSWMKAQKLKAPPTKDLSPFYRNLEEALDARRRRHDFYAIKPSTWNNGSAIDLISNDFLSLGSSGQLRARFTSELECYGDLPVGSGGSRVMDGNSPYLELIEEEIAAFHGAETGLVVNSGYEANMAIFAALPRAGDVIVHDELVHASSHDGMRMGPVKNRMPFGHNDVNAFRAALQTVSDSQPLIKNGQRCVLIAVESIYSMDGDVCPLQELVRTAKEVFPNGNAHFIVDEAHSTGVIGVNGRGLVYELGLEKDVAIRLHTFGKALASSGAVILGNKTLKAALTNLARPIVFTTAPPFPVIAAARCAYSLMREGRTQAAQIRLQQLVKCFFAALESNAICQRAIQRDVFNVPIRIGWDDKPFVTPIIPIWTRELWSSWLFFHLGLYDFSSLAVQYPVVPRGESRVRLVLHAGNTTEQVERLVNVIGEWAQEMMEIDSGAGRNRIPKAARQMYARMSRL